MSGGFFLVLELFTGVLCVVLLVSFIRSNNYSWLFACCVTGIENLYHLLFNHVIFFAIAYFMIVKLFQVNFRIL